MDVIHDKKTKFGRRSGYHINMLRLEEVGVTIHLNFR